MNNWVYDIEQFDNFHSIYFINTVTNEEKVFIIWYNKSDISDVIDQRKEYISFLREVSKNKDNLIGYNNIGYDYPMLHEFIKLMDKHNLSTQELVDKLYDKTNQLISKGHDNKMKFTGVPVKYHYIRQIDLFKIHHFDNANRRTSLKKLSINIRWHDVRDLPIEPGSVVIREQIPEILSYNKNDVLITKELYWLTVGDITKITVRFPGMEEYYIGRDRINFRDEMSSEYNIDCTNFSDVKIGEEINKKIYLKLSKRSWNDIKNEKTHRSSIALRDLVPKYIDYKSNILNDMLYKLKDTVIVIGNEKFKHEFLFANNMWTLGLGGIHTKDTGRIVTIGSNELFNERDVGSMYPNKIIEAYNTHSKSFGLFPEHLGVEWLVGYKHNRDYRLEIKPLGKTNPRMGMVSDVLKLALNGGGYGKTGDVWNWQYDPLVKYTTTIQCQLDIMMLADMLYTNVPLHIESGNTDGINIIYDKKYNDKVNEICKQWEVITKSSLETTEYQKLIRTSVNDYMAIQPNGKVKRKGDFELNKELHKDTSMYIVKKAIDLYYRENIPIEKTITSCKNIFDFTKSIRVGNTSTGSWKAKYSILNNSKITTNDVDKNIRYFVDNTGTGKLFKYCYDGKSKGKTISVDSGKSVTLFNKYVEKPFDEYKVNYNYYISEAMKIKNNVFDGQLTLF